MKPFDVMFKGIMIGNSGSGKSCLLAKFCNGSFNDYNPSTIGIDFACKHINVGDKNVKIQLWDTSGQERFRSITTSYFRGAEFCLILFDLHDRESFEATKYWYDVFSKNNSEAKVVLVGTKKDLDCEIDRQEIRNYAKEFNCLYAEASSKTGEGVECLFTLVTGQLLEGIMHSVNQEKARNDIVTLQEAVDPPRCPQCSGCGGGIK